MVNDLGPSAAAAAATSVRASIVHRSVQGAYKREGEVFDIANVERGFRCGCCFKI